MTNPYTTLPARNFWSPAVGKRKALEIDELWVPKWPVTAKDAAVTFGSCFAQHFGRALAERGYNWANFEPAPDGLSDENIAKFNYRVFSARTGNIYTANILHQWCQWATGRANPPDEEWQADGRFYDPFRPAIEPDGFWSQEEMCANRAMTIAAFGEAMRKADVFVFTLGLTESWRAADGSVEYAACPGTVAGRFDPAAHVFVNEGFVNIRQSLTAALALLREVNPGLRVLLTVSPVPLTATAGQDHVLVATTHSKSVLRAVAGEVAAEDPMVDYFPSYEIITAPPYRGRFFAENKRSVLPEGVAHVMEQFFKGQTARFGATVAAAKPAGPGRDDEDDDDLPAGKAGRSQDDLVCEEALLDAFGPRV